MPALAYKHAPEGVKPQVRATADEVVAAARAHGFNIQTLWGYASFPDHVNRRCVDYMILGSAGGKAAGDWIANYHIRNAARLGVNWIIWDRRIYRNQNTNRGHGWAAYTGPKPHTDHVHVEYDGSAYNAPPQPPKPVDPGKPLKSDAGWYYVDGGMFTNPATGTLVGLNSKGDTRLNLRGQPYQHKSWENIWVRKIVTAWGHRWAVTPFGTYYRLDFLNKGKATPGKPPPPVVVKPPPVKPPVKPPVPPVKPPVKPPVVVPPVKPPVVPPVVKPPVPPPPAVLPLSKVQLASLASDAGFSGDTDTAAAIALAESSGRPDVINRLVCVGLWQINQPFWVKSQPTWTVAWLQDPVNNAAAAFEIYRQAGRTFRDWSTFNSGTYKKYL